MNPFSVTIISIGLAFSVTSASAIVCTDKSQREFCSATALAARSVEIPVQVVQQPSRLQIFCGSYKPKAESCLSYGSIGAAVSAQSVALANFQEDLDKLKRKFGKKKESSTESDELPAGNATTRQCRPNVDVKIEIDNNDLCMMTKVPKVWVSNKTSNNARLEIEWEAPDASGGNKRGVIGGIAAAKTRSWQQFCATSAKIRKCDF